MINPRELRLGNYVHRKYWNPHPTNPSFCFDSAVVCRINATNVNIQIKGGAILRQIEVEPIPLTEEWLVRFGFRESISKDLKFLPVTMLEMEIHAAFFMERWVIELANDRRNIITETRFVHQLQNLYYALTGQELTYNPK